MKWTHMTEAIPDVNRPFMQCFYYESESFQKPYYKIFESTVTEYDIAQYKGNFPKQNWWWIYAKDFPFPKLKESDGK